MKIRNLIVTSTLLYLSATAPAGAQTVLNSFETSADLNGVTTQNATMTTSSRTGVTNGSQALKVTEQAGAWPGLFIRPSTPWNIANAGAIAFDITNPGTSTVSLDESIYDALSTSAAQRTRYSSYFNIPAGQTVTFYMPLVPSLNPAGYGVVGFPAYPSSFVDINCWGTSAFDLTQFSEMDIYTKSVSAATPYIIDNLRTLPAFTPSSLIGSIDQYGQSTLSTWSGKVQTNKDLATANSTETTWLNKNKTPAERDSYGGWAKGPALTASGYFRTTQYGGKWWLVTPGGHLFFASGIDTLAASAPTFVDQRSSWFQWQPASTDPLSAFYGTATSTYGPESSGTTYDFYCANLERKYGTNWQSAWQSRTLARLKSWGFNTIGNWSDPALCSAHAVPYVVPMSVSGTFNTVSSGSDLWGQMVDPYDPRFAAAAATSFNYKLSTYKNDPWCIGYYVDNEPSWGSSTNPNGLAYGALGQNATSSPAKTAFISQLESEYATIDAFNSAWGTSLTDWSGLSGPFTPPSTVTSAMAADMSLFTLNYARQYFQTVAAAIHAVDPNHLYLGCRFSTGHWTPSALQACAENCDVISFNIYANTVDPTTLGALSSYAKPAMVGEFSFGATDHGNWWPGLVPVASQAARGTAFTSYFNNVLSNHQFVGLQWYDYIDQPVSGTTFDGENGNMGFVDITDTPISALTTAASTAQQTMYSTRNAAP